VGSGFSDKPEHGYEIPTYVEHVNAFIDTMNVQRASLIGVSLGAWIAARFALTYPRQTDKLTLLSAAGVFANEGNMNRIRTGRSAAVDDPTWDNIKPMFDKLIHQPDKRIDDIIGVRQVAYRQRGIKQAMQNVLVLQQAEVRKRNLISEAEWRSIEAPALVIGSVDDPDEYLETARIVSKLMPKARYVEMRNVGHWPHFEEPEEFNRLNLEFLTSA
jgi:2-hydroxy-6-oxonona-2,4-dienedioate hydrolase